MGDGNVDDGLVDVTYGGMLEVGETRGISNLSEEKATSSTGREVLEAGETPANIDHDISSDGGFSGNRFVAVESPGAVSVHQSLELVQPIGAVGVRVVDRGGGVVSSPESPVVGIGTSSNSSKSGGFLGDASALSLGEEVGIGTDVDGGRERESAAVDVDREDGHVRLRRSRLPRR